MTIKTEKDKKGKDVFKGMEINRSKPKEKIGHIEQGQWVGIVDAWMQIEKYHVAIDKMEWWISFEITKVSQADPVMCFAFDALKLNKKVFESKKGGMYMRQCIYAHWLEDAMTGMKQVGTNLRTVYQEMNRENPKLYQKILSRNHEGMIDKTKKPTDLKKKARQVLETESQDELLRPSTNRSNRA